MARRGIATSLRFPGAVGPSPLVQLSTSDPDDARQRLVEIYCEHEQTVLRAGGEFRARQSTIGFPGLELYELGYGAAEVRVRSVPFEDFVIVSLPVGGPFALSVDGAEPVAVHGRPVVMDGYGRYEMHWGAGCRLLGIRLARERVESLAGELLGLDGSVRVRFGLDQPTPGALRGWQAVARSLWQHIVPSGIADHNPLVRAQVLRMTVAALLETFPNSTSPVEPVGTDVATPAVVRRAISYMDQCAAEDIELKDIAAAARVGPRALQLAFRRHMDTTPLRYLREVRLRRANAELREADPDGPVTVGAIANRWGFSNMGRFAEEHRKVFGVSPGEVLRRRSGAVAMGWSPVPGGRLAGR
jgi:AraC-like DNA-binding protein